MSERAPRVCAVGGANTDLVARLPGPLVVGACHTGRAFHVAFGGKGSNQAVMAARLGARVSMVGRVGADRFGQEMLANYQAQGIDTHHVVVDERLASGTSLIVVEPSGRNTIAWVPGANGALSTADVRAAAGTIAEADVLLCELEVPRAATLEALRIARTAGDAGPRAILNVAPIPDEPIPAELLSLADVLVVNELEAHSLVGVAPASPAEAIAAAQAIAGRWSAAAVVTLGPLGAAWALPIGPAGHLPAPTVDAVDTTGAGDAFVGTLACVLGSGRELGDAVRAGIAVASISVARTGAQSSYPTLAEAAAALAGASVPGP